MAALLTVDVMNLLVSAALSAAECRSSGSLG